MHKWLDIPMMMVVVMMVVEGSIMPPSRSFNIGGLLHDNITQRHFSAALRKINFDGVSVAEQTTLYDETTVLRGGPLTTALHVCDAVISKSVFAVIVASPPGGSSTTAVVSYTCGFFHIPVICTHSRDSAFSNKDIHASLVRTVPPYSQLAEVWVALLQRLHYHQIIFFHSADPDGHALYSRFRAIIKKYRDHDKKIKVPQVVEYQPGKESFVEELSVIREQLVKVILLYASESDATTIFRDARYLNMTVAGYVWIIGEQSLGAPLVPQGTLGFQLKYADDYQAHITDSLRVVALALRKLHEGHEVIPTPPLSCDDTKDWQSTGQTLFKLIREQVLMDGQTGKVAFDRRGDRTHAEYTLVNVQHPNNFHQTLTIPFNHSLANSFNNTVIRPVGEYFYNKESDSMELIVNNEDIVWPGGSTSAPPGYALPKHLRVLTMREKPFVYARAATNGRCSGVKEVLCPKINDTSLEVGVACCYGYCVDLLLHLAANNDFTFDLFLYPEAQYGNLTKGPEDEEYWTGIIGRLLAEGGGGASDANGSEEEKEEGMDMIVAPLTITPDRAKAIHFSKPFKYHGITILVKQPPMIATLVSILQPFRDTLWLLLLATVHVIAFIIWLLDQLSPDYKYDGDDETDSLVLSESFWFSWSVILNSGLTEGTPRCLSGRVLGIAWAGFTMIMVASYTANLAAFLVLEAPENTISGINDPRLRNAVDNFSFGTVAGSAVDMFFRRKTEWSNMYRVMETHNFNNVDEAVEAVCNGSLQAFFWESSRLEYEASQDCELVTVGDLFGRSGYGIGLKKGSPWADKITLDILDFHERGYMENLDKEWIWLQEEACPDDHRNEAFFKRLGLKNLEGIFIMVVGGILSGIFLVLVEIFYDRFTCGAISTRSGGGISIQRERDHDRDNEANEMEDMHGRYSNWENRALMDPEQNTLEKTYIPDVEIAEGSNRGIRTSSKYATPGQDQPWLSNYCSDEDQAVLDEIDERLRTSPHIPETWKVHSPLVWCQHYLDLLSAEEEMSLQERTGLADDFAEFVKKSGARCQELCIDEEGKGGLQCENLYVDDEANGRNERRTVGCGNVNIDGKRKRAKEDRHLGEEEKTETLQKSVTIDNYVLPHPPCTTAVQEAPFYKSQVHPKTPTLPPYPTLPTTTTHTSTISIPPSVSFSISVPTKALTTVTPTTPMISKASKKSSPRVTLSRAKNSQAPTSSTASTQTSLSSTASASKSPASSVASPKTITAKKKPSKASPKKKTKNTK